MFDKQYRFSGTHARYVIALTAVFDEESKSKLFDRNLDVYINAPLIGYLYNRKGVKNNDGDLTEQNIFPEQMIHNSDQMKFNLRLILLLDDIYDPDEESRINRAFRNLGKDDADLALYDSYVLGGVEVLYEKLVEGCSKPDDYINHLYDFLDEFNDRFNSNISNESILTLCNQNRISN